jgi:hypothetical protein
MDKNMYEEDFKRLLYTQLIITAIYFYNFDSNKQLNDSRRFTCYFS